MLARRIVLRYKPNDGNGGNERHCTVIRARNAPAEIEVVGEKLAPVSPSAMPDRLPAADDRKAEACDGESG